LRIPPCLAGLEQVMTDAEVYDALAGRSQPRKRDHTFSCTELLRCATCGGMLTGDIKKRTLRLLCMQGTEGYKRFNLERLFEEETPRLLRSLRIDTRYDSTQGNHTTRTERLQKRGGELRAMRRKLRGQAPSASRLDGSHLGRTKNTGD
jgi:hypothetical protein